MTVNQSNLEAKDEESGFIVRIHPEKKSGHFTDGTEERSGTLTFNDNKTVSDYDGAFLIPKTVAKLIRSLGYKVPRDMC